MSGEYPFFIALLPPLLAIILALCLRRVLPALAVAVLAGCLLLSGGNPVAAAGQALLLTARIMTGEGQGQLLLFIFLMGALLRLLQSSGAVNGLLRVLSRRFQGMESERGAGALVSVLAWVFFMEYSLAVLIGGAVAQPLFRRLGLSREKLAYLLDSACAPVTVLLPLNGWGAFLLLQLKAAGIASPLAVFWQAWPCLFYPFLALALTWASIAFSLNWGAMKEAQEKARLTAAAATEAPVEAGGNARDFILPMSVLTAVLLLSLAWTGRGNIFLGQVTGSLLAAVSAALLTAFFCYQRAKLFTPRQFLAESWQGIFHVREVVLLLALTFGLSLLCRELGTAQSASRLLLTHIPLSYLPFLVCLLSAGIAFTSTSWSAFAVMIPTIVVLAAGSIIPLPWLFAAVISGAVWGDHLSPLSDTAILSSLAADCPILAHWRTQLPYALAAGGSSAALFLAAGWIFF